MRTGLLIGLFLVGALSVSQAQTDPSPAPPPIGLEVGQMAPDFLLPSIEGGFIRLSDYRGSKVILFHFASW